MNDKPLLKTPGEMISEAREAQDLTVNQLSERTKIPPPVLAALELDEYHKISGPLYIKSFLRTCAMDLGLDPETVLGLYNKISGDQGGAPGGRDMIWEEDKVKVSRIGLPWIQIALVAGIAAVLIGLGLFGLRGCGADQEEGRQQDQPSVRIDEPDGGNTSPVVVAVDSASEGGSRRESLIPPETEAELKGRMDADPAPKPRSFPADSLSVGWVSSPPPPVEEKKISLAAENASVDVDTLPVMKAKESSVTSDAAADQVEETPEIVPVEIMRSEPEATGGSTEMETPDIPVTASPVEDRPEDLPVSEEWIDSSWPLVLRLVCDSPQRIRVKRDGDREFSEVRWPSPAKPAPEVPVAGFEAGRVYRQGDRLVVFWGADDHFSLVLARVPGVEVAVNGRIRDISKLRPGQELILDSHSAGSSPGR